MYSVEIRTFVGNYSSAVNSTAELAAIPHTFLVLTDGQGTVHGYGFAPKITGLSGEGAIHDDTDHLWTNSSGPIQLDFLTFNRLEALIQADIESPPYYDLPQGVQCAIWAVHTLNQAGVTNIPGHNMISDGFISDFIETLFWNPYTLALAFNSDSARIFHNTVDFLNIPLLVQAAIAGEASAQANLAGKVATAQEVSEFSADYWVNRGTLLKLSVANAILGPTVGTTAVDNGVSAAYFRGVIEGVAVDGPIGSPADSFFSNKVIFDLQGHEGGIRSDDLYYGTAGSDSFLGAEQLSGDAGDDTIYVGTGANVINGGPGLDTIHGETGGSKTYLFGAASELDTLSNWNATPNKVDILLIDAELAPTDITLALEETPWGGSNLIVQSTSTGARFTVIDYGSPWATSANRIDQIKFADGTTWHEDEIRQLCAANPKDPAILIGTPWTDSLYGGTITSQIKGLAGNDALNASSTTNALVVGGPGDDTLYGGAYTHFLFEAGDGQDTVYAQNNNQLEWGTSLIGHTVTATKQGSDLVVKTDTGDSVTVVGWAQAQAPSLKTPYGQVWSAPVVNSKFRPDYTGTHYGDGYYAIKDINAAIQAKLPTDALRRQYEGYIRMGTDAASTSQTMVSHGYYNANGAVSEYGTWLGTSSHWIGAWSDLNPSPSVVTPGQNSLYDYAIVKYTAFLGPDRQIDVAINSVIARTMTLDEGQRLGYNLPLGLDPLYTNPESQVVLVKGIDSFKLFG